MNDQLKAYLDDALSPEERTQLETELQINPALQQELEELKATGLYLEACAAPIEIKGLESTLAALTKKRTKLPWFRSPYAVLAACTVFVALVMPVVFPVFAQAKYPSSEFANAEVAASSPMAKSADSSSTDTASPSTKDPALREIHQRSSGSPGANSERETDSKSAPSELQNGSQSFGDKSEDLAAKPNSSTTQAVPNNRQIIKTADLSVRVKDLVPAATRAEVIAKQYGGFVENSSRYNQGNAKYANYVIRVKSDQFDKAMTEIRKLGEVTAESISGNDVTGQIADTAARLKQKRLEEAQYQEVLKSARKISDILEVKQYISDIREEIEATEAQLKSLKDLASLSTITLNLEQRETIKATPPQDWLSNAWIRAINRFSGIGQYLIGAAINILVLAPFWLPFALGIWWWNRKRSR
ncbi:MAG: DUF4349 domain-containing protein [Fimbriimonadaceae bacterium]